MLEDKIVIIGSSGCGKTTLFHRFTKDIFTSDTCQTIGIDISFYTFTIDNKTKKFELIDTVGVIQGASIRKNFLKDAKGAVLCYSICDRNSFKMLKMYLNEFRSVANPNAEIILVGTMADINHREVTLEEARLFAQKYDLECIETSSKTGANVTKVFEKLFKNIIDGKKRKQKAFTSSTSVFQLSIDSHKQINFNLYENDFEFIFCNNKSLRIPSFLAESLSPVVSQLRLNDPTISSFEINMMVSDKTINKIIEFVHGNSIKIKNVMDNEFIQVLIELKNRTIFQSFSFALTVDNVAEQLFFKKKLSLDIHKEIRFAAEHFEEIKNKNFTLDDWVLILSSKYLKLNSEKSLLDFIRSKMTENHNYFILLKFLHHEFLDQKDILVFVSLIDTLETDQIGGLWTSIRNIFISDKLFLKDRYNKPIVLQYNGSDMFNGIFDYLSQLRNDNILKTNEIVASYSSIDKSNGNDDICNIFQDGGDFCTEIKPDQWILVDFKQRKVSLTSYSIRTVSQTPRYPNSWKLEGSNDKKNWSLIDMKSKNTFFTQNLQAENFNVNNNNAFQFIKLSQIGRDSNESNCLAFNRLEFFGYLYMNDA